MKRPTLNRFRASPGHSGLLLPPSVDKVGRAPGEQVGPGLVADIRPRETVADSVIARDVSGYGALADSFAGNCFSFDGVADYINCGNDSSIRITGALTLGAWFRTSTSSSQTIHSRWNFSGNEKTFITTVESSGALRIQTSQDGATTRVFTTASTRFADGNWHSVYFIFNPSTSVEIYVDGGLELLSTTNILASLFSSSQDLRLAAFYVANTEFIGELADICMYSGLPSADDIAWAFRHRRLPHQRFGSLLSASDLKGYWPMSEGFQDANCTLVIDHSGNGNHGTNVNGGATPVSGEEMIPQLPVNGLTRVFNSDSTNDYNNGLGVSVNSNPARDWTIAGIFSTNQLGSSIDHFQYRESSANRIEISFNPSNRLLCQMVSNSVDQLLASANTAIEANKIYHCAVVHTNATKTITYYLNGTVDGSDTYSDDFQAVAYDDIFIMNTLKSGLWDENCIFSHALNASEIAELYNNGLVVDARRHSRGSTLDAYWRNGWTTPGGQLEDLQGSANLNIAGAPERVVLQALPDNPTRHALGGFVRQEKGFSFPESGTVRLLGPHVASNPELDDNASGWTVGCSGTAGDGYVECAGVNAACDLIEQTGLTIETGAYYLLRAVVDSFSTTAGNLRMALGSTLGSTVITAIGVYEDIVLAPAASTVDVRAVTPTTLNARVSHFSVRKVILQDLFHGGGSFAGWIRPFSHGQNNFGRIWNTGIVTDTPSLRLGLTGQLVVRQGFTTQYGQWRTNNVIPMGEWSHVAVVYEADVAEEPLYYVNGQLVTVVVSNVPSGTLATTNKPLYIGNEEGETRAFSGDLGPMQFWNRLLSATEVSRLFSAQRDEYGV